MVCKGTRHKTSTQNLRVFCFFEYSSPLLFSEIQYLLLETIPLDTIMRVYVLDKILQHTEAKLVTLVNFHPNVLYKCIRRL